MRRSDGITMARLRASSSGTGPRSCAAEPDHAQGPALAASLGRAGPSPRAAADALAPSDPKRASPRSAAATLPRVIADDRFSPYFLFRLRSWLRRHGVGSFWLPVLVTLAATAPGPTWCQVHSLLMVRTNLLRHTRAPPPNTLPHNAFSLSLPYLTVQACFSLSAHLIYRSMDPGGAAAGTRRGRAPTSIWLHVLRLFAGLGRWVFMPLIFLHATCNYAARTQGPELFAGARQWNLDMPFVDGPKLVTRLLPLSSRLLPSSVMHMPLLTLSLHAAAAPQGRALTLTAALHPIELQLHPVFAFTLALFLLARVVQIALWLLAAPPLRKDSKLRVLIVGDSIPPKVDGVAVRVGHLVPTLLAKGHSVHIVNSIRSEPMGAAGVTQLHGWESELYRGHSITLPNPLGVLAVILRFRPHVIHIMDESFLQASAQVAASVCLIPTVWSHHSRLDKFAQACACWSWECLRAMLCVCVCVCSCTLIGLRLTLFFSLLSAFLHGPPPPFPTPLRADLPSLYYLPWLFMLQSLRRTFASASDVHLSVGDDMAYQLEQAGCGPDISNWACGVDSAVFNPARAILGCEPGSLRSKLTAGRPTTPIVLYCGRVAPEKRLELLPAVATLLLERMVREGGGSGSCSSSGGGSGSGSGSGAGKRGAGALPKSSAGLSFVIIGDGPALADIKRLMAEVGPTWSLQMSSSGSSSSSSSSVDDARAWRDPTPLSTGAGRSRGAIVTTFLGQVSHCPALGTVYASCDAFFSPSTCETLGQVFQESMASALVPTGCRFGGVPEVFDHDCEGYLFEPEDIGGAVEGISRALADRCATLGAGAAPMAHALPPAWLARGTPGRGEVARARVLSKSWAAAYAQAESAYYRALATRWPYSPNKPLRR